MMIMTPTTNKRNRRPTTKCSHEDLLRAVKHEAHLRQFRHEQHQHVLRELLRLHAFDDSDARDKLLKSLRLRSTTQRTPKTTTLWDYKINVVLKELIHMTTVFGACPSRRCALMEEIRAVGRIRAEVKENHMRLIEELPYAVWRRHMMKELHMYVSSRHLIQDMKLQMMLELHRQKEFRFPSMRRRLLRQIRAYGEARSEVKKNHELLMAELKQLFAKECQKEERTALMEELHAYASSRNLIRNMKLQMMLELHRQKAFRLPSTRKRLLRQIRAYGKARSKVKRNHLLLMSELKQHFAKEWQKEKRTVLMAELCDYTARRRKAQERKQAMLLELKAHQAFRRPSMKRNLMSEIHTQTSKRNDMKVNKDKLIRDLRVFYAINKLMPGRRSFRHASSSASAAA